jgi:hypothetical protein
MSVSSSSKRHKGSSGEPSNKKKKDEEYSSKSVEDAPRRSFTNGWDDDINYRDALPIIDPKTGKVVRVRVPEKQQRKFKEEENDYAAGGDDDDDNDDGFDDESSEVKRDGQGRMVAKAGGVNDAKVIIHVTLVINQYICVQSAYVTNPL